MAQVNLGHVVGPGVPTGGTANQVLVKNGSTNFDASWKDASQLPAIGDEATAREAADAALADGLAIIANGDTHAAVAAGQAVFVRSHSTLAPGLYWASSAIGTNAALSTSNLTADSQGGLNKLKGDIDSLNSKLAREGTTTLTYVSGTYSAGIESQTIRWMRSGNIVMVSGEFKLLGAPSSSALYAVFSGLPFNVYSFAEGVGRVSNSGKLITGVRSTQPTTDRISMYFMCADDTYPSSGSTIEFTLTYYTGQI